MSTSDDSFTDMPSGMVHQKAAFEDALFDKQENDPEMSLQVLSNCVNFVNCTILRERRLLPDSFFKPFAVYGDISGYMLDQTHPQAMKVLCKMNSIDVAIRRRQIYKVAVVVERELNTQPIESFVWSISYGVRVSAEIGYNGTKSSFNVDYRDMNTTCQEFCKLFNGLQEILKELLPLPIGMVPSLKVAYLGEPEFSVGFKPVEEFVNMEQIGVGAVAFPYNDKFHLSYASDFIADRRGPSPNPSDVDDMETNQDLFDDSASIEGNFSAAASPAPHSPTIEVARDSARRTLSLNNSGSDGHNSPVFQDLHIDEDLMSGNTKIVGHSIVEPVDILPSEMNEFSPNNEIEMEVDEIYGTLEKSPEKLRSARRVSFATDIIETPVTRKLPRMPSLLDMGDLDNQDQNDGEGKKELKRYGRVPSVRSIGSKRRNSDILLPSSPVPIVEQDIEPGQANSYGRVPSVRSIADSIRDGEILQQEQHPRYGMSRTLTNASEESNA